MTNQIKGFSAVIGIIIILVIAIGAAVGYYFYEKNTEVEVTDTNSIVINHNTNAGLPAGTRACEQDSDCEPRFTCEDVECFNVEAQKKTYDCYNPSNETINISDYSCVCAEKECTVVENNQ